MWTSSAAPLFYRHWLELRVTTLVVCAFALAAALPYAVVVLEPGIFAAPADPVSGPGPAAAFHAVIAGFFALWAPSMLAGSGFGAPPKATLAAMKHPSACFTASLPVSRATLVLTRLAASIGALMAALVVSLASHVIVLVMLRQPVPIGAMVGMSLMAAVGGLGVTGLIGFVTALTSESLSGPAALVAMLAVGFTQAGWNQAVSFFGSPRPSMFATAAGISAALIMCSVALIQRKDL